MAREIQFRRGTTIEHSTFTGAVGEITVDTTLNVPVVHDGVTEGGFPVGSKILQVVNKLITTQGSQTIGLSDTQIGSGSDFILNITPKVNDSWMKIEVRWFGEMAGSWKTVFNIQKDGVRINALGTNNWEGLSMATQTYGGGVEDKSTPEILTLTTLDKGTVIAGTSIAYKLVASAKEALILWTNRCFDPPAINKQVGTSEITITEIGV